MPVTLETIASSLIELKKSIDEQIKQVDERFNHVDERFNHVDERFNHVDERFNQVDERFTKVDERFTGAEKDRAALKSQLEIKLEALEAQVHLVYDEVIGTRSDVRAVRSEHATFTQLFDNHEVRISALESKKPAKR